MDGFTAGNNDLRIDRIDQRCKLNADLLARIAENVLGI